MPTRKVGKANILLVLIILLRHLPSYVPYFCPFFIPWHTLNIAILLFFGLFDLQFQIWPDPPSIIWGCPIILFLWFFCQGTPYASNFHFKYNLRSFLCFWPPFSWIFHIFPDFPSFCIHIHAAGLWTESVLVSKIMSISFLTFLLYKVQKYFLIQPETAKFCGRWTPKFSPPAKVLEGPKWNFGRWVRPSGHPARSRGFSYSNSIHSSDGYESGFNSIRLQPLFWPIWFDSIRNFKTQSINRKQIKINSEILKRNIWKYFLLRAICLLGCRRKVNKSKNEKKGNTLDLPA